MFHGALWGLFLALILLSITYIQAKGELARINEKLHPSRRASILPDYPRLAAVIFVITAIGALAGYFV